MTPGYYVKRLIVSICNFHGNPNYKTNYHTYLIEPL